MARDRGSIIGGSHIDSILRISEPYLKKELAKHEIAELAMLSDSMGYAGREEAVQAFSQTYRSIAKRKHQNLYSRADHDLDGFISAKTGKIKAVWGDAFYVLSRMKSESAHLMVTSPPYYNAREYSQWDNLDEYLTEMSRIISEAWRVLDNHRAFVLNVGDITGNDNLHTRSAWGARRIPLGMHFMRIFEEAGFFFVDDIIWDKGEVQSQRHKNMSTPSPLYQYPMNCYEHILIFRKHRDDPMRYPCPVCGCLKTNGNAHSAVGVRSWECKNIECPEKSPAGRGKRFSLRSIVMDELKSNLIDSEFLKQWRRDIIALNPVIKINSKGENILGHTAPFPKEIPEFAVKTLSGEGEIVLDPFAGSFTSAIEAAKADRIAVGIEINKNMFREAIVKNVQKHGFALEESNYHV